MTKSNAPVLFFNDECAVCRRIAEWVRESARRAPGATPIVVRPIGDDPETLRRLAPGLDIWDAYATIHLLMPDGSMKLGGEAVAEVFRALPNTRWFAWTFSGIDIFGFRPFQIALDVAYAILADVRPAFGCESCGTPNLLLRPFRWMVREAKALLGGHRDPRPIPHFTTSSRRQNG